MFQTITRKGSFDAGHRIVNHPGKCRNLHGHTYLFELTIGFKPDTFERHDPNKEPIGYPIDFADIKTDLLGYIDTHYDHAMIYNPQDSVVLPYVEANPNLRSVPMWVKKGFCNPSVENIALQIFVELSAILKKKEVKYWVQSIKVYETPNSFTTVDKDTICDEFSLNYLINESLKIKRVQEWK